MTSALIVGGDSDYNLGDAAILAALCHCFARSPARTSITITSGISGPVTSTFAADGGIAGAISTALPGVVTRIARGWREILACAREQNLIVVGGGGLFQDDDSRVKMPYWTARVAALRLANRNVVGHCVGAGPLRHAE